jgi:small subunit ribosomal protein S13
VEVSLTYIHGIGKSRSRAILEATNIDPDTRVKDLTETETVRIREFIDREYEVEGDLRRTVATNIKRMVDIGSYRGARHRRNLPVRGQRTRTNARTKRGSRKTVPGRRRARAKK